ncbi:MAG TPA: cation:proton antiporter, partial [Candidatus Bathyarchaeia archaeon]
MALEIEVVRDFAVIMVILSSLTLLFYILKQPVILGYLLAGIIVGPYTPPFALISQVDFLRVFAEFGIILLLLVIGLEFPLAKLRRVGRVAVGVALMEVGLLFTVGYAVGVGFGWSLLEALFLASALSISSTAIIVKVLEDFGILEDVSSSIMVGVLIVEDLLAVVMIASLSSFGAVGQVLLLDVLILVGKILLFVGGSLLVGSTLVPRLIDWIAIRGEREFTISAALGLCFGLSAIANLLGFSVATGAFLAGVLIAGAGSAGYVVESIGPLKELFAAL